MKKLLTLCLVAVLLFSLCGCQGNFGKTDLHDPIAIPENGVIRAQVFRQIKDENAIGIFTGEAGGLRYEWTVFGSDIAAPADADLRVRAEKTADGLVLTFPAEALGYPALLSVYPGELWEAQSATAYRNGAALHSVSLSGTKETILNLSAGELWGAVEVRPDPLPEDPAPQDPQSQDPEDDRVYSDGSNTQVDDYLTDPIPAGKPMPVEPEDQEVNTAKTYTCTFSIECSTILNNLGMLDPAKLEMVPSGGVILPKTTVTFYEGESVFDVLQRVCRDNGIHMESSWTPIYNSAYIEGIHNLYEFDCGELSGWMYRVNGWYPNYGCSRYQLQQGDTVEWRYTCDLGSDVGRSGAW